MLGRYRFLKSVSVFGIFSFILSKVDSIFGFGFQNNAITVRFLGFNDDSVVNLLVNLYIVNLICCKFCKFTKYYEIPARTMAEILPKNIINYLSKNVYIIIQRNMGEVKDSTKIGSFPKK